MKAKLHKFFAWVVFALTCKGELAKEGVDEGYLDFSGQGRDKYGN